MKIFLSISIIFLLIGCSSSKFTFVQNSDMHIDASSPNAYQGTNDRAREFVRIMNEEIKPDFVVITGDIIHGESEEQIQDDMKLARQILDSLNMKYYPVIGNHEKMQMDKLNYYFKNFFGFEANYTIVKDDMRFLFIDNFTNNNEYKMFLENNFDDLPSILFSHVPVKLIRDFGILYSSFGFASIANKINLPDNVILISSGHLHLTGKKENQLVISGTGSLPCDYAIYTVYDDSIQVEIRSLPNTENVFDLNGRAGQWWDEDHTDHHSYIHGNPSERNFTIYKNIKR